MEQRTDDWYAARLGKVTASRVADVVAKTKTGYSSSRENYMADLIVERLTGQKAITFTNAAMERGVEQEPHARAAYSARTGELVEEVGFIDHPAIAMSGASPDGLVADGLVAFKCPNTATHLDTLLADEVDRLVQCRPPDAVRFVPVTPEQAIAQRRFWAQQQQTYLQRLLADFGFTPRVVQS